MPHTKADRQVFKSFKGHGDGCADLYNCSDSKSEYSDYYYGDRNRSDICSKSQNLAVCSDGSKRHSRRRRIVYSGCKLPHGPY